MLKHGDDTQQRRLTAASRIGSQSGTDGPDTGAIQEPNVDVGAGEYKIISSFDEYPLADGYVQGDFRLQWC